MKATTIIVFVLLVSVTMSQYYQSKPLQRKLEEISGCNLPGGLLTEECIWVYNEICAMEEMMAALKASGTPKVEIDSMELRVQELQEKQNKICAP